MKKSLILTAAALFVLTTGTAMADFNYHTQSPLYTNQLGSDSFLGVGGYSRNHDNGTGEMNAAAVEKTAKKWAHEDKTEQDVIIKKPELNAESRFVPVSSENGYAYEQDDVGFINGYADGGQQGVNETKTIYTDGVGRLHFFGKGSMKRN